MPDLYGALAAALGTSEALSYRPAMTNDDLKDIGVPLGARKEILKLFAKNPHPPEGPVPSNSSPRRKGTAVPLWSKGARGQKYRCVDIAAVGVSNIVCVACISTAAF